MDRSEVDKCLRELDEIDQKIMITIHDRDGSPEVPFTQPRPFRSGFDFRGLHSPFYDGPSLRSRSRRSEKCKNPDFAAKELTPIVSEVINGLPEKSKLEDKSKDCGSVDSLGKNLKRSRDISVGLLNGVNNSDGSFSSDSAPPAKKKQTGRKEVSVPKKASAGVISTRLHKFSSDRKSAEKNANDPPSTVIPTLQKEKTEISGKNGKPSRDIAVIGKSKQPEVENNMSKSDEFKKLENGRSSSRIAELAAIKKHQSASPNSLRSEPSKESKKTNFGQNGSSDHGCEISVPSANPDAVTIASENSSKPHPETSQKPISSVPEQVVYIPTGRPQSDPIQSETVAANSDWSSSIPVTYTTPQLSNLLSQSTPRVQGLGLAAGSSGAQNASKQNHPVNRINGVNGTGPGRVNNPFISPTQAISRQRMPGRPAGIPQYPPILFSRTSVNATTSPMRISSSGLALPIPANSNVGSVNQGGGNINSKLSDFRSDGVERSTVSPQKISSKSPVLVLVIPPGPIVRVPVELENEIYPAIMDETGNVPPILKLMNWTPAPNQRAYLLVFAGTAAVAPCRNFFYEVCPANGSKDMTIGGLASGTQALQIKVPTMANPTIILKDVGIKLRAGNDLPPGTNPENKLRLIFRVVLQTGNDTSSIQMISDVITCEEIPKEPLLLLIPTVVAPQINLVCPSSIPSTGNVDVTILGTNFSGGSKIFLSYVGADSGIEIDEELQVNHALSTIGHLVTKIPTNHGSAVMTASLMVRNENLESEPYPLTVFPVNAAGEISRPPPSRNPTPSSLSFKLTMSSAQKMTNGVTNSERVPVPVETNAVYRIDNLFPGVTEQNIRDILLANGGIVPIKVQAFAPPGGNSNARIMMVVLKSPDKPKFTSIDPEVWQGITMTSGG